MIEKAFTGPSKMRHIVRSRWPRIVLLLALVVFAVSPSFAQTTTTTVTKTVQVADTWTIIEYPLGKEVTVKLIPGTQLTDAEGWATVHRAEDGTRININVALGGRKTEILEKKGVRYRGWKTSNNDFKTCIEETIAIDDGVVTKTNDTCKGTSVVQANPKMSPKLLAYAVDDTGLVTLLGSVVVEDGTGTMRAITPLAKFMLVLSPFSRNYIDSNMGFTFHSAVPAGFAVIPRRLPEGEKVAAIGVDRYPTDMIIVGTLRQDVQTELNVYFFVALSGANGNVVLTPRNDGPTEMKLRFNDLKEAPAGQAFVLWAVSRDYRVANLGRLVNAPGRNEGEVKAEIAWPAFGLFITVEDSANASGEKPVGPLVGYIGKQ